MFISINPYNQQEVFRNEELSGAEVNNKLEKAQERFNHWRLTSFDERRKLVHALAQQLRVGKEQYGKLITLEMGKPVSEAIAEIEKCATLCEFYSEHAEGFLRKRTVPSDAAESYVSYEPLGVILGVMPWNFPFWQVFRFAVPTIMAGNTVVVKHASNVMESARHIEIVFAKAGFPEACFLNLPVKSDKIEAIIRDERIKAVSLTGSSEAGKAVASVAGSEVKKTVLELGGSNALVVFADCDIERTVKTCVQARFQNAGQSCIAGKRLLVHQDIADEFISAFIEAVGALQEGNPLDSKTTIGPMARTDLAGDLEEQLSRALAAGARVLCGGNRRDAFFEPTVVGNVAADMSLFAEEIFGPVIGFTTFQTDEEAVEMVNSSRFGLGTSLFGRDVGHLKKLAPEFADGAVFINEKVMSDPRLPFGGTKISGYGRELSEEGIREFVNIKTIYIKRQ